MPRSGRVSAWEHERRAMREQRMARNSAILSGKSPERIAGESINAASVFNEMGRIDRAAKAHQAHLDAEDKANHTLHTAGKVEYHDAKGRFTSKAKAVTIT